MAGITGESLEAYVFFGPVYYQKLKHMGMAKSTFSDGQSSIKCTQEHEALGKHLRDSQRKVVRGTEVCD